MDARVPDECRFATASAARMDGHRGSGPSTTTTVVDASLGIVGFAVIGAVLQSRRSAGRTAWGHGIRSSHRLTSWLVLCGLIQIALAIGGPWDATAAIPVASAAGCWAAAWGLRGKADGLSTDLVLADRSGNPSVASPSSSGSEEQVRRLADDLVASEARCRNLAEAAARRDEFLAVLGHELRNPLAPIRNALRIMKQRGAGAPEYDWARDVVEQQLAQLNQLVDDLLEVSRVACGKLRLDVEPVDVSTILTYAFETSRPMIEARRHRLSINYPSPPLVVSADPNRIAQVFVNLLNNAAKYTEDAGQIRLSAERSGEQVVFRVRDSGVGIPSELLPRIFELFSQADRSLNRSEGGLGLGLTLVRSVVELHGGTVEAHSDGPGQGSEFVVRLPLAPAGTRDRDDPLRKPGDASRSRTRRRSGPVAPASAPLPAEFPPLKDDADTQGRRILIVDDNDCAAQTMAMILKLEGYEVRVVYNAESAMEALTGFRPEAVLSDIGLPGFDGYELARRIRGRADLSGSIRLLAAITGRAEAEARRMSKEAGFDHHLVKPVDPEDVLALLASIEWREAQAASTCR